VAWQDDRGGTGHWNTWCRSTADGGVTWIRAARLSDRPGGAFYKHPAGYEFVYGDYFEIDVGFRGRLHVIWGAGESYYGAGECWYTRGSPVLRRR